MVIPQLKSINKKYNPQKFKIVSIVYNTESELKKFFEEYKMPWTHGLAATDSTRGRIAEVFNIRYTPTYYFVSPKGKILADQTDFEEEGNLEDIIADHL